MGRRLACNVALQHPERGVAVILEAGSVAPAWAEDLIDNPEVWGDVDESYAAPVADPESSDTEPGDGDTSDQDGGSDDVGDPDDDELPDPPEATATTAVWLAYGNDVLGLGLAKKAKKADIVKAVEARLAEIDAADE